jgi:hypothetical protein
VCTADFHMWPSLNPPGGGESKYFKLIHSTNDSLEFSDGMKKMIHGLSCIVVISQNKLGSAVLSPNIQSI